MLFIFYRVSPSLTSGRRPPTTTGPTISQPISERPTNALSVPVPVKHQRPFTSGPKGYTIWYSSASDQSLSAPPASLPATAGTLYIHTSRNDNGKQVWLCNANHGWANITTIDNVKHPSLTDRFLLLRSDGIPSWLTGTNYAVVQSRKEKPGR